jgi:hypothetical protein
VTSEGRHPVADAATNTVRIVDGKCATCIFRPGNQMHLQPGRVQGMLREAISHEGHIVCHDTLDSDESAICSGFAEHPDGQARSLALRMVRAGVINAQMIKPA